MAYRTSDSGSVLGAFAMPTTSLGDKDAPVSAETLKKLPMSPNDIPSPLTPVDPATALNDREYTSPPLTDADGAGTPSHARRPGGSGASNSSLGSTNGLGPSSFPRPTSSAFDARHSAVAAYSTPIISPLTSSGVVEATDAAGRAFGPGGLIDTSPQRPVVLPSMPKAWRVTDMDGSALPNGNPDLNRQHSEETSDAFDFIESMQHRSLPLPPLPSTPGAIKMEGMAQRFHLVPDLAGSSQDGLAARGYAYGQRRVVVCVLFHSHFAAVPIHADLSHRAALATTASHRIFPQLDHSTTMMAALQLAVMLHGTPNRSSRLLRQTSPRISHRTPPLWDARAYEPYSSRGCDCGIANRRSTRAGCCERSSEYSCGLTIKTDR